VFAYERRNPKSCCWELTYSNADALPSDLTTSFPVFQDSILCGLPAGMESISMLLKFLKSLTKSPVHY